MSQRFVASLPAVLPALAVYAMGAASAAAEIRVAATVAPVHSLVAMVTDGLTVPDLIVRPGASPHNYALKPSEAQALDEADVVFWVGEGLEPWMVKALTTLAGDADVVELGEVEGVQRLGFRKGGLFEKHAHEEHGDEEHAHGDDGHEEHAHEDHAQDASDEHGGHDHHDHGDFDPHLWLDPNNAAIWLNVIAFTLADADPANAAGYKENAAKAVSMIEGTVADIETLLQPVHEKPYIVFHDAYQYYESRFDLHPLGAISLSDADRPGPARLIDIKEAITESGAVCVFSEPQFEPRLVETVIEGTDVATGSLDPIGAGLEPGADLYPQLILGLAESLADCLG